MTSGMTAEDRARRRAREYVGFMWHLASFAIINLFLWGLDWVTGNGIEWAYWVTVPWAVGLAFHAAAYFIDDSRAEERAYQRFLSEERDRENRI